MSKVETIFARHKSRYGYRRIKAELESVGTKIGAYQIRSLMKQKGLKAIQPKSYVPVTTNPVDDTQRCTYLLEDKKVARPNEVFVGDITYIRMQNDKFLYLATWQDMYSRTIVGWDLMDTMRAELVISALNKALNRRNTSKGLIIHTDGGRQYIDKGFKEILKTNGFEQSMTRKDNHYDNAMAESWFSRMKSELVKNGAFMTKTDAYTEINEYIEVYYNRQRRHSSLGYQTPAEFEKKYELSGKLNQSQCVILSQ